MGVTAKDLYKSILTFVFGEAQINGKAAIISLFRPRGDAGGPGPSHALILRRLIKLGLHELGHTFGLEHCRRDGCLMGFASNLEKLDRKNLAFCKYCQVLLADYLRDRGVACRLKGYAETPEPGAPTPTADNGQKCRQ